MGDLQVFIFDYIGIAWNLVQANLGTGCVGARGGVIIGVISIGGSIAINLLMYGSIWPWARRPFFQ